MTAAGGALLLSVFGGASIAQALPTTHAAIASSVTSGSGSGLVLLPGGATRPPTDFTAGKYIVTLTEPAAASYPGGIDGLAGTKPTPGARMNAKSAPVEDYSAHLKEKQQAVAADAGVSIEYSYTLATNGFSAELSPEQAAKLSANKDVARIEASELKHIQKAEPSTTFLGLDGSTGVWAKNGGIDAAGAGVVVGDLDTGIAPENPSFAGDPLGTTDGAAPFVSANPPAGSGPITFHKADGTDFHGTCVTGEQFTAADCSTKIIGAQYFIDGFGEDNIGTTATGEYLSPRDGDGHGSHTASTAAGNNGVNAVVNGDSFGDISGVAPAAKIAVYKVCWSGPDPTSEDDDGCTTPDIVAAIDQSVADGVDVLNFSIGGSSAQTTLSASDYAFLGAASAGIFVAASAGNSGPDASTLDNGSPWYTTVAASTIPSYEATVTLGNGKKFAGGSITVEANGNGPLTGPLVRGDEVALPGADTDNALLCGPGTLDPAKVAGDIVFCERGVFDRTAKSDEVKRAGGIGMLLVNKTPSSIDLDLHAVPTVHLDSDSWDGTYAYSASTGATATFTTGNQAGASPAVPQLAGFSSHGPVEADGSDILKPDISAPGVAILAATANAEGGAPTYAFYSGTSMAAPHIAGLAALYLGVHPLATPAEIKSAMMTTGTDLVDASGAPSEDVFGQGAGNVKPTSYLSPGLLYLNGVDDWLSYLEGIGYDAGTTPIDASDLNLASIAIGSLTGSQTVTRTVTSTEAGTFTAAPVSIAGITTTVSPSTLTFGAAGESQSYTVTLTRTDAALNEFATGYLTWSSGSTSVRSPIAVRPVAVAAPLEVDGTGTTGSVDVTVTPGSDEPVPLNTFGLAKGSHLTSENQDPSIPLDGHSAVAVAKDTADFTVTVPAGVALARFDLTSVTSAEDGADLDLFVDLLDSSGKPVTEWSSATGAANERVDIQTPTAGTYLVTANVFAIPSTQDTAAMDLYSFLVPTSGGVGSFTAPATVGGAQGQPATYTASWTGLDYSSQYLGQVAYGDTGVATYIGVTTEAEASTPPPTAPPTTPPTTPPTSSPSPSAPAPSGSASAAPGDPGAGSGSGSGSGSSAAGWLASTGLSAIVPIGLAGILLLAGISALVVQRRRSRPAADSSDE
ncbi:S8 family peptidase [Subtercola endophyticus]|uniref:S8 family peptidase n=1 Tax=Subtercola endophyticus TaxID=2895559 RepID=UPI001E517544|nr:S8 family peptidase [Subtercola endophyticus]UFS57660.1 S8 family serine peptidase [Subtercola endophyticus]